jgi:signal transduction histidine kinase
MKEFSHPAVDKAPHDLNRAIASTITVASNEWKYVADVTTDFDADLPLVPVMPGAFNQVILNILVNAAHAIGAVVAEAPATRGVIRVSTRKLANWVEIRIQDSGGGIPEGVRDRIFDPFFTTKEVGKGTGQGLAIAHDVIVKKHHGAINVESAVGVGTTFILRLPLELSETDTADAA